MQPNDKQNDDDAFAKRLRASAPSVPAAGGDVRQRMVAMTESTAKPVRAPWVRRWAQLTAAAAAGVLLYWAAPLAPQGTLTVVSVEERFVWETFSAMDDGNSELALGWSDSDE